MCASITEMGQSIRRGEWTDQENRHRDTARLNPNIKHQEGKHCAKKIIKKINHAEIALCDSSNIKGDVPPVDLT